MRYFVPVVLLMLACNLAAAQSQSSPIPSFQPTNTSDFAQVNEDFATGLLEGQQAAMSKKTGRWVVGGLLAGSGGVLLSGLTGGLAISGVGYGLSSTSRVELDLSSNTSTSYRAGYQEGYAKELRRKKRRSVLVGGLIGTLGAVGGIVINRLR